MFSSSVDSFPAKNVFSSFLAFFLFSLQVLNYRSCSETVCWRYSLYNVCWKKEENESGGSRIFENILEWDSVNLHIYSACSSVHKGRRKISKNSLSRKYKIPQAIKRQFFLVLDHSSNKYLESLRLCTMLV